MRSPQIVLLRVEQLRRLTPLFRYGTLRSGIFDNLTGCLRAIPTFQSEQYEFLPNIPSLVLENAGTLGGLGSQSRSFIITECLQ